MLDLHRQTPDLADSTTLTLVTRAGIWVIDRTTLEVIKYGAEKPGPDPWSSTVEAAASALEKPEPLPWSDVLEAGLALLQATEGVEGLEELHAQAAGLVVMAAEAIAQQATTTRRTIHAGPA